MRIKIDYLAYLKEQCNLILCSLDGNNYKCDNYKIFDEVCKHLYDDFLPPINREDIASISYLLMTIYNEIYRISDFDKHNIKIVFQLFPGVIEGILKKNKTCEINIRRLIDIKYKFSKTDKQKNNNRNDYLIKLIDDFIIIILNAHFKNL